MQPNVYLLTQTYARGGFEGVNELATTIRSRQEDIEAEVADPSFGPLQAEPVEQPEVDSNLQGAINQFDMNMPQIDQPIFEMPGLELSPPELTSPSILPNEKDREIAMRQVGGIGSLV